MKYEIEGSPVESTGSTDSWACEIAQNDVAFDAWSSKLYTRKERAIVRELSCNAWDAHVMAGKADLPFEIHLPTTHEPYFEITDFGTGMTHDEMKNLFTMYFGSNKRNSNMTIGALGLGSKSPYCYKGNGGTYTVISRKDGETRMYVATKKNGRPHMDQSGPTLKTPDVPNGISIKFGVEQKDIWTWENEAKIALEFITPKPKINIANFEPTTHAYTLRSEKWGLRRDGHTAFGYQTRAIMGNVQYQVGDIDRSLVKTQYQSKILGMPIDMFFPLGALDFSLNREALEFTPKTINALLAMADFIFEDFLKQVKEKLDKCKYVWEANILLYSLISDTSKAAVAGGSTMGGLINDALNTGKLWGKYSNFELTNETIKLNELLYRYTDVVKFQSSNRAHKADKFPVFSIHDRELRNKTRREAKNDPIIAKAYQHTVKADDRVLFVINDLTIPGDKYIHFLLQESSEAYGTVYVIRRNDKDVEMADVVREGKKMVADMGHPPYKLMSQIEAKYPQLKTVRGEGGSREKREIVVLKRSSDLPSKKRYTAVGWTRAWRKADEAELESATKYYVVLDKLVASDTGFSDVWGLAEFVGMVQASGQFGVGPVFGLKRNSKILKNNGGDWVPLLDHVYAKVKEIMTPKKTLAMSLYLKPFGDSDYREFLEYVAAQKPLAADSPIQQFALALEEAKGIKFSNWSTFQWVLNFCAGRHQYKQGLTADFNQKWAVVKEQYPMLEFVGSYSLRNNGKSREKVLTYIRLVEEENKREALALAAASNA